MLVLSNVPPLAASYHLYLSPLTAPEAVIILADPLQVFVLGTVGGAGGVQRYVAYRVQFSVEAVPLVHDVGNAPYVLMLKFPVLAPPVLIDGPLLAEFHCQASQYVPAVKFKLVGVPLLIFTVVKAFAVVTAMLPLSHCFVDGAVPLPLSEYMARRTLPVE